MVPSIDLDVASRLIIVTFAEDTSDSDMYVFDVVLRRMPEYVAGYGLLVDTTSAKNNSITEEGMQNLLTLTRDDTNLVGIVVTDYENFRRAAAFESGSNGRLFVDNRVGVFASRRAALDWFDMKRGHRTLLEYLDSLDQSR